MGSRISPLRFAGIRLRYSITSNPKTWTGAPDGLSDICNSFSSLAHTLAQNNQEILSARERTRASARPALIPASTRGQGC